MILPYLKKSNSNTSISSLCYNLDKIAFAIILRAMAVFILVFFVITTQFSKKLGLCVKFIKPRMQLFENHVNLYFTENRWQQRQHMLKLRNVIFLWKICGHDSNMFHSFHTVNVWKLRSPAAGVLEGSVMCNAKKIWWNISQLI